MAAIDSDNGANARKTQLPESRRDLESWIHDVLCLPAELETELLRGIDGLFSSHERLWRESKEGAILALLDGYSERINRIQTELQDKDATVSGISRFFEDLVLELNEKSQRDPKTNLLNLNRFVEKLELFLVMDRHSKFCAVGQIDITGFKWCNDTLGHAVGDKIIARVAQILTATVRHDEELLAHPEGRTRNEPVEHDRRQTHHARFGGDEFCFLIPDLPNCQTAHDIGERFRLAVQNYEWSTEDPRLEVRPVRVDVGVVCLELGPRADRIAVARKLAADLMVMADELMYQAKGERADRIYMKKLAILEGQLYEVS